MRRPANCPNERAKARAELALRRERGGLHYFVPQEQQIPVLACTSSCLVLGGNRCIAGDTVVSTDGRAVEEIDGPFECWAWDGHRLVRAQAQAPFVKGMEPHFTLTVSTGEKLTATLGHLILTRKSWETVGDLLLRKIRFPERAIEVIGPEGDAEIVSIVQTGVTAPYYDFCVPGYHNYYAGGVINHNSGKTSVGAVRAVRIGIGVEKRKRKPHTIWCVSQELPGGEDKPHTQLEELRRWMPHDELRGGSWATAYSTLSKTLTLKNGVRYVFKGYDQDLLSFESASVDHIWYDEEPTRSEIFSSGILRLLDRAGTWAITLTPILSLQGKSAVAEKLWELREEGAKGTSPYGRYETFQLFTSDNPYLPAEEVAYLDKLPEEEKQVRLYGAFARLGGRVLAEFNPARHLVDDFLPPPEWRHFLVADPGWRTSAHLWAAVDPDGCIWLYAEHYAGEMRPDEHVAVLDAMYAGFVDMWGSKARILGFMDPAGFSMKRTTTGKESPSDAEEYHAAARKLGANWLRLLPADNSDSYAWRVKRYLQEDKLKICRGLRWWQWEQERWTRQKERGGPMSGERPIPDEPIKRYDHLMDCLTGDTMIEVRRGGKRISSPIFGLRGDDYALTREGWRPILSSWVTGEREVIKLTFSDGGNLTATSNHPVWIESSGWRNAGDLKPGDVVRAMPEKRSWNGAGGSGAGIPTRPARATGTTTGAAESICTSLSGVLRGVVSRRATRCTISTATPATTRWRTLTASLTASIGGWITSARAALHAGGPISPGQVVSLLSSGSGDHSPVSVAGWNTPPSTRAETGSAAAPAKTLTITNVERLKEPRVVYNLQVADTPEFYANGVLVHNCTRYLVNELPDPLEKPVKVSDIIGRKAWRPNLTKPVRDGDWR